MSEMDVIAGARQLPSGAHFFKCALQVNPFAYLAAHGRTSSFTGEEEYNAAIIKACHDEEVDAIAVTDHYRVRSSAGLIECSRAAGIEVFPGFEAVTKDGFICSVSLTRTGTSTIWSAFWGIVESTRNTRSHQRGSTT